MWSPVEPHAFCINHHCFTMMFYNRLNSALLERMPSHWCWYTMICWPDMRVYPSNERSLLKIATQNSNFENLNSESSESRVPQVSRLRLLRLSSFKRRLSEVCPAAQWPRWLPQSVWCSSDCLPHLTASCDGFMRLLYATASPHLTACFIRLPHPTVSFKRPHPFRLIVGQLTNCWTG